jgi:hypothetical protein
MLAIGFPGCMNPPIIWTNGWIMKPKPVIAKSDPKNRVDTTASIHAIMKPHLQRGEKEPISSNETPLFRRALTMGELNQFCR